MNNSECYLLLEIDENATNEEIKKAYRRKAHQLHPDKNRDTDTTQKFQELNHAYQILINKSSTSKNIYDNYSFYNNDNSNLYEADIYLYNTNIETLTCECNDFQTKRYRYPKYDPRRLCRHLIAKFFVLEIKCYNDWITPYNIHGYNKRFSGCYISKLKLPIFLEPFRPEIEGNYHNNYRLSLNPNVQYIFLNHSIIVIHHYEKEITCMLKNRNERLYVDFNGNVTINNYYPTISSKLFTEVIVYLQNKMQINISNNLIASIKNVEKANSKDINEAWEKGFLLSRQFVCNFVFDIPETTDNKQNKIDIQNISNEHKTKFKKYINALEEIELKYDTTKNLLKSFKSDLSTIMFNKLLKEMGFLIKDKGLNYNDWIVIEDGNNYGMNYIRSSIYSHIYTPKWYIIKYFDYETLTLKRETRYGLQKMTVVLWSKDTFNELLDLVNKYKITYERKLKDKKSLKPKEKKEPTKRKNEVNLERESWLKDVECPYCNGKNIHKKDKRQRQNYQIQRYMCIDCNKIFQKKIDENS